MDISKYIVKDTTKCECNHQFDIHEINKLENITNHRFYSNTVKTCSVIKCPKCGKETVLLLKQKGQTWEIIGIAVKEELQKSLSVPKQTTIENKTENNTSNELICPICGKVCKNKSGLNAHMRTHNNN